VIRLAIDFEHPDRTWWESGGQELWEGVTGGDDESAVFLDVAVAESWLREASKLPGWEGGPEYAPHPIAFRSVEPDEEIT
jgi:hypothetical protein